MDVLNNNPAPGGQNDGYHNAGILLTRDEFLCDMEMNLEVVALGMARSLSKAHLLLDGKEAAQRSCLILDEFIHPIDHWVASNEETYFGVFCAWRDALEEYYRLFGRALVLDKFVEPLENRPENMVKKGQLIVPSTLPPKKYWNAFGSVSNTTTEVGAFFRFMQGRDSNGTQSIHQGP